MGQTAHHVYNNVRTLMTGQEITRPKDKQLQITVTPHAPQ